MIAFDVDLAAVGAFIFFVLLMIAFDVDLAAVGAFFFFVLWLLLPLLLLLPKDGLIESEIF